MPRQKDSSIERVILVLLDLTALFLATNLAFDIRYYLDWHSWFPELVREGPAPWGALYQALPYMLLGWFVIFATFGLYQSGIRKREEISRLIKAQMVAFTVLFSIAFFYRGFSYSRLAALFLMPLSFLFSVAFRMFFRIAKEQLLRLRVVRERILIVGRTEEADALFKRLLGPGHPFDVVGILAQKEQGVPEGMEYLGTPQELGKTLTRQEVDRVLLLSGDLSREELMDALDACYRHRVGWAVVPDLYDLLVDNLHMLMLKHFILKYL